MKQFSPGDFVAEAAREASDEKTPTLKFYLPSVNISAEIEGADVETCIAINDDYLVFTTNDCPYEETLNITLINSANQILDQASIFWPYGTGSFNFERLIEPNKVVFQFFAEKLWQVELFEDKKLVLPFISEPTGVWRKLKLSHRFKVSEIANAL